MAKKMKMILYAEPGVGKSVFAGHAPKPFFFCTDGNYEWLEDLVPNFDEKNHLQLGSFAEAEKEFNLIDTEKYAEYDTIVVDLIEDLYKWADYEMCKQNRVKHISELGDYGKGYDLLRKPFKAVILKLLAADKNVILLSHESSITVKNKRGVESTKFQPSNSMSIEKLWDEFTGQVRFCIRAYKDYKTDEDGHTVINRLLNIQNQPDEYGTFRIADPNAPQTIPLDWDVFAEVVGLTKSSTKEPSAGEKRREIAKQEAAMKVVEEVPTYEAPAKDVSSEAAEAFTAPEEPVVEKPKAAPKRPVKKPVEETKVEETPKATANVETTPTKPVIEEGPGLEKVQEEAVKPLSAAEKIAAVKAKLAALQANKK